MAECLLSYPVLLLFPLYLLTALIGYVFYAHTQKAKVLDLDEVKTCRRHAPDTWYEVYLKPRPFWENNDNPGVFFIPPVNILFLVIMLWQFWRRKRITNLYLYFNDRST